MNRAFYFAVKAEIAYAVTYYKVFLGEIVRYLPKYSVRPFLPAALSIEIKNAIIYFP